MASVKAIILLNSSTSRELKSQNDFVITYILNIFNYCLMSLKGEFNNKECLIIVNEIKLKFFLTFRPSQIPVSSLQTRMSHWYSGRGNIQGSLRKDFSLG